MSHVERHLVVYNGIPFCKCDCEECLDQFGAVECICPDGCQCGEH